MAFSSRRRFLTELSALAGAGAVVRLEGQQRGLEQFVVPSPPCTEADLTPALGDVSGFKAGAPERASLIDAAVPGPRVNLSGFVIGLKCGRVKDARLDVWHADPRGVVDQQGFRFRGYVLTDANGRYRLDTTMPGAIANRAPQIAVRLTPPGQPPLTTVLFFPDDPKNARDPQFAPKLVMKKGTVFSIHPTGATEMKAFTFNFILNL
jgi:protocatechuate 3,4-dioxygenase beta subunit